MSMELLIFSFVSAFLGTIVMTVSQEIEVYFTRRPVSFTPAIAVFTLLRLDFEKLTYDGKVFFTYLVHFAYGTFWGFALIILFVFSLPLFLFILLYYIIILVQGWVVLFALGIIDPPWKRKQKEVMVEMVHKLVYALSTAFFFFLFI